MTIVLLNSRNTASESEDVATLALTSLEEDALSFFSEKKLLYLTLAQESPRSLRALITPNHVDQRTSTRTQGLLAQGPSQQLPALDQNLRVRRRHVRRFPVAVP